MRSFSSPGPAAFPSSKRWLERLFLLYTPLWTAVCALVMWSGAFKRWGDVGHMLFGVGMALPLWLAPLFHDGERGIPLQSRYTVKASVFIALFSFLQNYFGAPLFFRCFGMEYHFHVTWVGNGSPWFLSFLTVAYFSTYFAIMQLGLRRADALLTQVHNRRRRLCLRALCCLALGYSMAFAETLTMANEWLRGYFAYADKAQMLMYGSLCYGTLLSIALPLYAGISDKQDAQHATPLSAVVWQALGANMLVLICYELFANVLIHGGR
jgi:cycloeucalenol cycloisomerase